MLVEFPIFGAGINYFPTEISALRVFEPRYLLLIADAKVTVVNDITSTIAAETVTATTSGVTTTTTDPGIYSTVY